MKKTIVLLVLGLLGCTAMRAQEDNEIDNPECDFVYQDIGYHITDSVKRTVEIVYLTPPLVPTTSSQQVPLFHRVSFNDRDVSIPEEIEHKGVKYTVTGIDDGGFSGLSYDHINILTLPPTIKRIGKRAFARCERIRKIVLTSEESIDIGEEIIGGVGIEELELSNGVEKLFWNTFGGNNCLKRIKIGNRLHVPEDESMDNCFLFLEALEAFELSPDNPYLSLHKGVLFNHDKTKLWAAPSTLKGTFEIPEGTVQIARFSFRKSNFSNIKIPSSLRKISDSAFAKSSCVKVDLPEGLEVIEEWAFSETENLEEVIIPSTIKQIYKLAFNSCPKLKAFHCHRVEPPKINSDAFFGTNLENCVLYVPVGCVEAYRNAGGWTEFKHIEEEVAGVDGIATDANAVQSVKYVNMAGMESDKPFAGLNIVVTTRADGSRHATKQQF